MVKNMKILPPNLSLLKRSLTTFN